MDILTLERIFSTTRNPALDKFVDLAKLDVEVEKFGEKYRKRYLEKLERQVGDAQGKAKEALGKGNSALDKAQKVGKELTDKMAGVDRAMKGLQKFMGVLSGVLGVAGLVISLMALKASEGNQAAFDRQIDRFQIDASKQLSLLQTQKFRIDKANAEILKNNKAIEVLNREADLASDAIKLARSWADRAYKLANDGLYESRVRLQRLNNTVAQANSNASKALVQNTALKSNIQAVDTRLKAVDTRLKTVDSKVVNAANEASQARIGVKLVDSKASTALATAQQLPAKVPGLVVPVVNNAIAPVKAQVLQAQATAQQAKAENPPQNQRLGALEQRVTALANVPRTNQPTTNQPTTNQPVVNQAQVNQAITNAGVFLRINAAQATADAALRQSTAALNKPSIDPLAASALAIGTNNTAAINKLNQDVQQLGKAPNVLEPRVTKLEQAQRANDRVNQEVVQKLDAQQALITAGVIAGLTPAMQSLINRGNQGLLEQLPGATATAVAAAPCNGKGCGGRTAQRVDGIADEVGALRQQVNNMPSALNTFNAGANAAQLGLLTRIDQTTQGITGKLGNLLPNGGISGFLKKMAESTHLDKVLLALNLYTNVHNAYQLSSGLTQTLFSATSNVLAVFGVKDLEGNPLDIGTILGKSFDETMQQAFGVTEWEGIKAEYKKYNRIYQAASNLLFSVQSMVYNIQDSMGVVGSWVAQMGNGMRKDGVASENAWRWFNPQPNFKNPFFNAMEKLENLEQATSQIDQVASNVLSVQQTATEIVKQKAELDKALGEVDGSKQGAIAPEAAKVKAAADAAKLVSKAVEIPKTAETAGVS